MSMTEFYLRSPTVNGYVRPSSMILKSIFSRLIVQSLEAYRVFREFEYDGKWKERSKVIVLSKKTPSETNVVRDMETSLAGFNVEYTVGFCKPSDGSL